MAKRKVALAVAADGRRVIVVDDEATKGATVGENLYRPDGSIITMEELFPPDDDEDNDGITQWKLIYGIPQNIKELAKLVGVGFAWRNDDGTWRLRQVGRHALTFTFGDATPDLVWTIPHNLQVIQTRLVIDTPFNGVGASVDLGTAATPDLLFATSMAKLTAVGSYSNSPDVNMVAGDEIEIVINPGAGGSAGAGRAIIDTIPLEGI